MCYYGKMDVKQKENNRDNKKTKVKGIFGKLKFKKSTQEILDGIDKELEPELSS